MKISDLRQRVIIERPTSTRDSYNAEVITWVRVGTFWAHVRPLAGREYQAARLAAADVDTRILMRYQPSVTIDHTMRVKWDSRYFEIRAAIQPDNDRTMLELHCQERV